MITRKIKSELVQCASEYPAVTILGPRQSGKTTLARMTFPALPYVSLEDPDIRRQALHDPRGLLAEFSDGAVLDEIQRVPKLLSYLQGMIDANPMPGRFILTGSHQPMVHQAVSQSLAGRTAMLELLPFTIEEVRRYKRHPKTPFEWIVQGFYPRLHENQLRPGRFYNSYLATYIERDLRVLLNVKNLDLFDDFLHLLAGRVGQLVNYASLSSDLGVSAVTIKNWISVLKASYILFELRPYFTNIRKRVVKSSKLYFTDVALATWLLDIETPEQAQRDPLRGSLYENLIIMEVVKKIMNVGDKPRVHFYRDANNMEVDLLISAGRSFTAIEIKSAATFQGEFVKGLHQFQRNANTDLPIQQMVWHNGTRKTTVEGVKVSNPLLHGFTW